MDRRPYLDALFPGAGGGTRERRCCIFYQLKDIILRNVRKMVELLLRRRLDQNASVKLWVHRNVPLEIT